MMEIPNKRCDTLIDSRVKTPPAQNSDWFLDLLKMWLGPASSVVESGTDRGVSSRRFASMFPLGSVVTIDPKNTSGVDPSFHNLLRVKGSSVPSIGYDPISAAMSAADGAGFQFPWGDIDLVYLDSIHNPRHVRRELRYWMQAGPRVIGGHDYGPYFPGYSQEVCDFFQGPPHIVLGDTSWFYMSGYMPGMGRGRNTLRGGKTAP